MYEVHFGLQRRPFNATPDIHCCYLSQNLAELSAGLLRNVEEGQGISLLLGNAGTGKSLLLQMLQQKLQRNFLPILIASGQFASRSELLQAMLFELGQPYSGMTDQELRLEILSSLRESLRHNRPGVLLLDEAHLLDAKLLEEIRLMGDWNVGGQPVLRILLAGQPALEEQLTLPALSAFNQRVVHHAELETLTQQESQEYLQYRLHWAGGNAEELIAPEALELMARIADGLPRCLNQLGDHVLLLTYLVDAPQVTPDIVQEAMKDLQHLPLHWNLSPLQRSQHRAMDLDAEQMSPQVVEELAADLELGEEHTASFEFGADDSPADFTESNLEIGEDSDAEPQFLIVEPDEFVESAQAQLTYPTPANDPAETLAQDSSPEDHSMPQLAAPVRTSKSTLRLRGKHAGWLASDLPLEERVVDDFSLTTEKSGSETTHTTAGTTATTETPVAKPQPLMVENTATTKPAAMEEVIAGSPAVTRLTQELARHRTERALELIDALLPVLDEEVGPRSGAGIAEFISPPRRGTMPAPAASIPASRTIVEDLGEAALELGLEIEAASQRLDRIIDAERRPRPQQPVAPSPEHREHVRAVLQGLERTTRFDVVEPAPQTISQSPPVGSGVPRPKLSNLFTQLRRRQMSGS